MLKFIDCLLGMGNGISKLNFKDINKKKFKSLTTMAIGYSLDGGDLKSREIFKTLKK